MHLYLLVPVLAKSAETNAFEKCFERNFEDTTHDGLMVELHSPKNLHLSRQKQTHKKEKERKVKRTHAKKACRHLVSRDSSYLLGEYAVDV